MAEMEWQDIESAPKVTDIDLWAIDEAGEDGGYRIADCRWVDNEWKTRSSRGWEALGDIKISHWMPLPPPPRISTGGK